MNIKKFFSVLGPGVITGAADDDPSGIATYVQAGGQFGYSLLWSAFWMLPLIIAIQEASARIGAVTGKGIAAVLRETRSRKTLHFVVILVLFANTINIGADISGMAAAAALIVPLPRMLLAVLFTVMILLLEIFVSYKTCANLLKWLCLSLFAYPLTVFFVREHWWTVLRASFVPHIEFSFDYLFIVTGVFGTTISPYLFFWQASEEVEEEAMVRRQSGNFIFDAGFMRNLRLDNFVGMLFSEVGTWSIILVGAAVLHAHGVTQIATAAEAAQALEPLVKTFPHSGYLAKLIFASGIIGLGLLAIPVLAGSAAYALAEACKWETGLNLKFSEGPRFYGIILVATLIGFLLNSLGISPFKALVYAAVVNGVVAVPLIYLIARTAASQQIMGQYRSGFLSRLFVGITFVGMGVVVIGMFAAWIKG